MLIPSRLRLPLRPSWLQRAGAAIAWGRFYAARHGLDPSFDSDSAFDLETEDGSDAGGWDYAQPDSAQTTLEEFEGFFRAHEARLSAYLWRMTGDRQGRTRLGRLIPARRRLRLEPRQPLHLLKPTPTSNWAGQRRRASGQWASLALCSLPPHPMLGISAERRRRAALNWPRPPTAA